MTSLSPRRRSLQRHRTSRIMEQLESRVLLSANFATHVTNGLLYVQGDNGNDNVVIDQASLSPGQFRVASGNGVTTINGQSAGALWHPPYRLDISRLLKSGQNRIEIRVYNTALNAWSALPPHDYKPLIQKYGDRFQMQDLNRVAPISSGLLGQVHLTTAAK